LKDDEEEIPIDGTDIDLLTNTFTMDNSSIVASNDVSSFNSTIEEIKHTLSRQDLDALNQTDELTTIEQSIENVVSTTASNETYSNESEITSTKDMDVNQETSNETIRKFLNINSI
jgi:hypothetical protein